MPDDDLELEAYWNDIHRPSTRTATKPPSSKRANPKRPRGLMQMFNSDVIDDTFAEWWAMRDTLYRIIGPDATAALMADACRRADQQRARNRERIERDRQDRDARREARRSSAL